MTESQPETWQRLGDEFHMAMGYCIAAWAQVDDELFRIFCDCIGPYDQSAIIYYRTPGLEVRLNLTEEIVRTTLLPSWARPGNADPRMKAWKPIAKDFRDLLAVRRRIAHHPVAGRVENGVPTADTAAPSWFEIYVGAHERLRDSAAKLPALRADDLRKHLIAVFQLRDHLRAFFHDVLTKPQKESPPPSSPSPPMHSQKTDLASAPRHRRRSSPA